LYTTKNDLTVSVRIFGSERSYPDTNPTARS